MNIEELVKMPDRDPALWFNAGIERYTADQLRAYGEAVAAAVAKRCADLCDELQEGLAQDEVSGTDCADAIRREFGEASNDPAL